MLRRRAPNPLYFLLGIGLSFFLGLKLHDAISGILHPSVKPAVYGFTVQFLEKFPPKGDIAFVGDSHIARADWNALMGRSDIANFGVSGDGTKGVLGRLDSVMSSGAKHVVILIGVNDLIDGRDPDDIKNDIHLMIEKLRPHSKISLVSVMPTSGNYAHINGDVRTLDAKLRSICTQDCRFIDAMQILGEQELERKYSLDGLHLNVEGYAQLSKLLNHDLFN
jgi:lysophospholipase L1-like esterase